MEETLSKLDFEEKETLNCQKQSSKLEQIAILQLINSHPSSAILRTEFKLIPDSFHSSLSNIITLQFIEQSVIDNKYSSSMEMVA